MPFRAISSSLTSLRTPGWLDWVHCILHHSLKMLNQCLWNEWPCCRWGNWGSDKGNPLLRSHSEPRAKAGFGLLGVRKQQALMYPLPNSLLTLKSAVPQGPSFFQFRGACWSARGHPGSQGLRFGGCPLSLYWGSAFWGSASSQNTSSKLHGPTVSQLSLTTALLRSTQGRSFSAPVYGTGNWGTESRDAGPRSHSESAVRATVWISPTGLESRRLGF